MSGAVRYYLGVHIDLSPFSRFVLAVLHGFGGCAKRTYARKFLWGPDEPKTDRPLYIVVVRFSDLTLWI